MSATKPRTITTKKTVTTSSPVATGPITSDSMNTPKPHPAQNGTANAERNSAVPALPLAAATFAGVEVPGWKLVEGKRGNDPDAFWRPKQAGRFQHTFWYAPEVKRYVKAHHLAWSMTAAPFAMATMCSRSKRRRC